MDIHNIIVWVEELSKNYWIIQKLAKIFHRLYPWACLGCHMRSHRAAFHESQSSVCLSLVKTNMRKVICYPADRSMIPQRDWTGRNSLIGHIRHFPVSFAESIREKLPWTFCTLPETNAFISRIMASISSRYSYFIQSNYHVSSHTVSYLQNIIFLLMSVISYSNSHWCNGMKYRLCNCISFSAIGKSLQFYIF